MVTLGYHNPDTGTDDAVEIGVRDEERGGYWAILIDPETKESRGEIFFAHDAELF